MCSVSGEARMHGEVVRESADWVRTRGSVRDYMVNGMLTVHDKG